MEGRRPTLSKNVGFSGPFASLLITVPRVMKVIKGFITYMGQLCKLPIQNREISHFTVSSRFSLFVATRLFVRTKWSNFQELILAPYAVFLHIRLRAPSTRSVLWTVDKLLHVVICRRSYYAGVSGITCCKCVDSWSHQHQMPGPKKGSEFFVCCLRSMKLDSSMRSSRWVRECDLAIPLIEIPEHVPAACHDERKNVTVKRVTAGPNFEFSCGSSQFICTHIRFDSFFRQLALRFDVALFMWVSPNCMQINTAKLCYSHVPHSFG